MQADYPGAEAHFLPADRFGYPNNNAHVAIVLHKTGGDPTPESVEHTFLASGKSVHYVVGQDGRVWQFVLESSGAGGNCCTETGYDPFWNQYLHTFNSDLNLCTLSIEHCDPALDNSTPLTPAQKDASFKLVAYLAQKYHIAPDHIKGHDSIDPIDRARCPGNYPWEDLWAYLKGAAIDLSNPVVTQYFTATPDGQWQCKQTGNIIRAGMLNFYRSFGADACCGLTYLGLPKSNEIPIAEYAGVVKQEFERGWLVYDPQHQFDNPLGAGEVYFMHLAGS
ncbi:MAG TPA: peptidoglycan recognition family protein [Ktedonobacteraceae bacterium]